MASERRRLRNHYKSKSSKRTSSKEPAATGPTTAHDVPDHLLEVIFLHLHSSACLLRTAATCKRWRRLVAEAWFLTRFRSLHTTPCIAGNYHAVDPDWFEYGSPPITGNPVFVPTSSSLNINRRHFSLDFLPESETGWEIADSRGSLLLVFKRRATTSSWASGARRRSHFSFPDLVVCEPLTRRFQGVLRPADVTTTCCLGVFLLDGDRAGGRIGMANFRIVSVLNECDNNNAWELPGPGTPVACVFSSGSDEGGWRLLPRKTPNVTIPEPDAIDSISLVGRANGSIYWVMTGEDRAVLAFHEDAAEFSRFQFPAGSIVWGPYVDRRSFRVIGGEDGALRVIRVIHNELKVFVRLHGGGDEWVLEKLFGLPEAAQRLLPDHREEGRLIHFHLEPMIIAADEKYVLLTPQGKTWPFSLELETMEVEREHERNKYPGAAYPCGLPWPPVLNTCVHQQHSTSRRRRQSN